MRDDRSLQDSRQHQTEDTASRGAATDRATVPEDPRQGAERSFKRRIDCSPRSGSPSWSEDRYR